MKQELIMALNQIEKEKGISKDILFEALEAALHSAYKRNFGSSSNVDVILDKETGDVKVFSNREVVEVVENNILEISEKEAKDLDPKLEIGDIAKVEVTPKSFGRIAAQTAKQVVVQRIREAERDNVFDEFINRESDIITGSIQRVTRNSIIVNLGKTEGILLNNEQIPSEHYQQGARIKAYILEVKKTTKGPQILLSRTHPGLVKRLFEIEVPEIHDGVVEVYNISREAGSRTKIAVYSTDEMVDPVGACVGHKGDRVRTIVDELNGEKIDIIPYHSDPAIFIANSLSPAKVVYTKIDDENRFALVVVPDYQLSLAIGKEGQNARLAAKLTGWKIDIKNESTYEEEYGKLNVEGAATASGVPTSEDESTQSDEGEDII